MSELRNRLKKNSTISETDVLSDSTIFNNKDVIQTPVPAVNIALSGSLKGGLLPGLTVWAGQSKHFKSGLALLMAKSYLDKYPDAVLLFYDSEFGAPPAYFKSMGIDVERVVHTPIVNVEQFKFDIAQQLEMIKRGDHVIIVVDSVGNLASKKEADDAINQNSAADMTRAKAFKSLFRIITPHLTLKDIPMVVVGHTYKTQEMYSKDVVSGGCLVEGTEIYTCDEFGLNEKLEEIQNVLPGDYVKTLIGPRSVTNIWNPDTLLEGEPECFEIVFEDGHSVICSDKHKFLIGENWVEAKNLNVNDDVVTYQ